MTDKSRSGSCACGAFHYEVKGEPMGMAACHCTACKKRTGAAFGLGCFFKAKDVVIRGEFNTYERKAESGRSVTHRFCAHCGTTIMWTAEALPNGLAIAGGSFDDPSWVTPQLHAFTDKALSWFETPAGVKVFQNSPHS